MTPRITNKKLESIAKDIEKARAATSLAVSRIHDLCIGDVRASDSFRISALLQQSKLLQLKAEDLRDCAESILLQRRSEVPK